jgi:hypothetical protein
MPRALAPALLLPFLALAAHSAAEVRVQPKGQRVDLTATAAPLAEVLDRLAREIGMKVVYDGPAPRQLVTVTLKDRTPSEAVLSVLEGLGVNFALVWDETGTRVQTLMVAGSAPATTAAAAQGQGRPALRPTVRRSFGPPPPNAAATDEGFEPEQEDTPGELPVPAGVPPDTGPTGAPGQANVLQPAPSVLPQQFPVSPFAPQPMAMPPVPPVAPAQPPAQSTPPAPQ